VKPRGEKVLRKDAGLPFAQRREFVVVILAEGGLAMADHIDHAHEKRVPGEGKTCQMLSNGFFNLPAFPSRAIIACRRKQKRY
jgi:hypothetical protein